MKKGYKYERPDDGQIEERWWKSLSYAVRDRLTKEIRAGLRERRDAWNRCHPPERQIPRPDLPDEEAAA